MSLSEGGSKLAPLIGRYCGSDIPVSHISSGNVIFLHFQSDGEHTRSGFKLEYNPFSKVNFRL